MSEGEKNGEEKPEKRQFEQALDEMREATRQKSLAEIERERDKKDQQQRFGFFTIPYPAVIGDMAYSQKKEYNHKIVDGKVVTENRGIFTQPGKKGKTNDVYFARIPPLPDSVIAEHKKMNQDELEKRMKEIKERKEAPKGRPEFKPGGPQILFGYYENMDKNIKQDGPLVGEKDKFHLIDKENRTVKTQKRGILPHEGYYGNHPIPCDLFSYPVRDKELEDKYKQMADEEKSKGKKLSKSKSETSIYRKPFSPASLKKCECFFNVQQTYCNYDEATIRKYLDEYKDIKKNGRPKFVRKLPPGAMKHDVPFHPARLVSSGRDALFNDDLYKIQSFPEEKKEFVSIRKIREEERQKARVPFVYNRMMNHSTFSPSLYSYQCNLKREFPMIYH